MDQSTLTLMTGISSTISVIIAIIILIVAASRWQRKRAALAKVTAVPIYKRPELKLYEIGTLTDGELHKSDILAVSAEHHLNPQGDLDEIEQFIIDKLDTESELRWFKSPGSKESKRRLDKFISEANKKVYTKLKQDGYYRFNPFALRSTCIVILFALVWINSGGEDSDLPDSYYHGLLALFLPFYTILALIAGLAYMFHENLDKVVPKIQLIKGYRMFFETTEKHRTLKDLEMYEKQMPLMIALGVYRDHWDNLLQHLINKWKSS